MDRIKKFYFPICLALVGIGILLLGAWDMQRVSAAPVPEAWYQADNAPNPIVFFGFTQCPDEPDKFYVLGSYPGETFFYSFDASINEWTTLPSFPIPIERSAVVCYAGYIYAAGGDSTSGAVDTLYIYNITNLTWTQGSNMPHPVKQAAVGLWNGRIYLVGGTQISLPWTPINHVDIYDIATDTWTDNWGEPIPFASSSAGYTQVGRYLYIVGGWSGDFDHNVNKTLRYDMSDDDWEDGPVFSSARAVFDLVATESHLYASGGDADGGSQVNPTDLVESLDLNTWPDGEWVDIADPLPVAIEGNAGFCSESVSGGEIWSIGGTDGVNLLSNTYYRPTEECADLYFGDWVEAESIPVPLAANLVQCVDDPDSFYMVGGILTGNITSNYLYRYDIAQHEWIQLADMPAPLRAVAATCYQGNIYVAGGVDFFIEDSFYIYNILSDTWTSGPSLPDPVWGAGLSAWDGKLYLVGGNQDGYPYPPVGSVDVFDITSGAWIEDGGKVMPTASCFFGTAQSGPYLYAVGGYSGDFTHNVNQTQRYNMAINEWEVGPEFTSARALGPLAASSSHLYMLGGDLDGGMEFDETDLVEVLDLSTWPDGSWTNLNDPLPANNLYPATACSDVLTDGEIWAVGGANGSFTVFDTNYYLPTGELCVSYGVDLPDPWGSIAEPGDIVTYTLSITNTGMVTDYFTLEVSTTWNIEASLVELGLIGPGESLQIEIIVEVPLDAQRGDVGMTEITAASISNPAAIDTTFITTTVYLPRFFIPLVVKN